jgi:hypothetical protein
VSGYEECFGHQRWYASKIGRFLTADPYDGGSWNWNRYAYVEGDPINFTDAAGLAREALDGVANPGNPFWLFAIGLANILRGGLIFGGGGPTATDLWKTFPKKQMDDWNGRIADEIKRGEEQTKRFVKALMVTGDCYQTSTLGGTKVRRIKDTPIDQDDQPFGYGQVEVAEQIFVVAGAANDLVGGGVWGPSEQNSDGSFYDYVGKTAWAKKGEITLYQTFTAKMLDPSGYMPSVARPVMIYHPGYAAAGAPTLYGVWGHWVFNDGVRTNNFSYDPAAGGMKDCPDDPSYP